MNKKILRNLDGVDTNNATENRETQYLSIRKKLNDTNLMVKSRSQSM